jgi:hypothetical protein
MKRSFLFFFFSFLLLVSCEQEDFMPNENLVLQTKSTENLNPIDQLSEIAVNIKSVGDLSNKYLSSSSKSDIVDRYSKDDGSLRQRWYISPSSPFCYKIEVAGGAKVNGKISLRGGPNQYYPVLSNAPSYDMIYIKNIPNTSYYHIYNEIFGNPKLFFYAEGSRDLLFKQANSTDNRAIWEIIPVEEFKLTDIKYIPEPGKVFEPKINAIESRTIENSTDSEISYELSISEKVMESSTFSKVEGLNMTNKITMKVNIGLPLINEGGEISNENTTSKNWSFEESKTVERERTIQDKISLKIPPHKKYIITIVAVTYDINVTYVATLVGKTSGEVIKLKGTWQGVECDGIDYKAHTATGEDVTIPGLRYYKAPLK